MIFCILVKGTGLGDRADFTQCLDAGLNSVRVTCIL